MNTVNNVIMLIMLLMLISNSVIMLIWFISNNVNILNNVNVTLLLQRSISTFTAVQDVNASSTSGKQ